MKLPKLNDDGWIVVDPEKAFKLAIDEDKFSSKVHVDVAVVNV